MKVAFSILVLIFLVFLIKAQTPDNSKSINQSQIQSLIQQNSSQLQSLGISTTQAEYMASQYLNKNSSNQPSITLPQDTNKGVFIDTPINFIQKPSAIQITENKYNRYAMDLFSNTKLNVFNKSTDLQTSDNYIIGTGDKINIAIWGYSSYSSAYIVDETGSIFPSQSGKIYLRGLSLKEAKSLIKSRFSSAYDFNNNQIEITVLNTRTITVNVVGEISQPGSYKVPAYNTVFNMLVAAGGPTINGSLRKIFVKRAGQTIITFDTYQFLQNPDSKLDIFLQDNDYIFIPSVENIVEIKGEVLRPMEYELLNNETIQSLINYSGGTTANAFTNSILIKRNSNSGTQFLDINYNDQKSFIINKGDRVTVRTIPIQNNNLITVIGPASIQGDQSFMQGEKISDLLKRNTLLNDAIIDKAFITRIQKDYSTINFTFNPSEIINNPNAVSNYTLQNNDIINFFSNEDLNSKYIVTITGSVKNPGNYTYAKQLTLGQLIYFSGGLKSDANSERIEVSRVMESKSDNYQSAAVIIKTIPLNNYKELESADAGFELLPNDIVNVRSVSLFNDQLTVLLKGEVMYPGVYTLNDKNEKLSSLINRAGGLTQWAYAENGLLYRNDDKKGIVQMRLDKVLKKPGCKYDFIIKKGDEIVVPTLNNIVSLSGQIKYVFTDSLGLVNVAYSKGKRAKFYIKNYGLGFNVFAKRNRVYVINPGNNVQITKEYILFKVYPKVKPGSLVMVPSIPNKEQRFAAQKDPVDWNRIIENTTIKITGLATLIVILSKVAF